MQVQRRYFRLTREFNRTCLPWGATGRRGEAPSGKFHPQLPALGRDTPKCSTPIPNRPCGLVAGSGLRETFENALVVLRHDDTAVVLHAYARGWALASGLNDDGNPTRAFFQKFSGSLLLPVSFPVPL